jgi:hypothetical protein
MWLKIRNHISHTLFQKPLFWPHSLLHFVFLRFNFKIRYLELGTNLKSKVKNCTRFDALSIVNVFRTFLFYIPPNEMFVIEVA